MESFERRYKESSSSSQPATRDQRGKAKDLSFSSIERLRFVSGLSDSEWNDLLRFSFRDYNSFRFGHRAIPISLIERVADQFNLSAEQIKTGLIDFHSIQRKTDLQKKWETPVSYDIAKHGRSRTTITTYEFIESLEGGWRVRFDALKSLGMSEHSLTDDFAPVSMRFISDTLLFLASRQFKESDFFAMGVYSYHANKNSILGNTLSQLSGPAQVHELLWGDCLRLLEENCNYRFLKLDSKGATLEVRSRSDVAEEMGVRALGNIHVCRLKAGMMASGSCYVGYPVSKVQETKCVHLGHEVCIFEIQFVSPN